MIKHNLQDHEELTPNLTEVTFLNHLNGGINITQRSSNNDLTPALDASSERDFDLSPIRERQNMFVQRITGSH